MLIRNKEGAAPVEGKLKSDLVLEEIERLGGRSKAISVEEEFRRLVIFTLKGDFYAFFGDAVKEIMPLEKIAFVPGCPDFIMGIINVRGDIESVLNIHRLIGLEDHPGDKDTRIVIAEKNGVRSGVLVDSVEDVIETPASLIKPPLSTLDKTIREFMVGGERLYRDHYVSILDVGKLFNTLAPDTPNP